MSAPMIRLECHAGDEAESDFHLDALNAPRDKIGRGGVCMLIPPDFAARVDTVICRPFHSLAFHVNE